MYKFVRKAGSIMAFAQKIKHTKPPFRERARQILEEFTNKSILDIIISSLFGLILEVSRACIKIIQGNPELTVKMAWKEIWSLEFQGAMLNSVFFTLIIWAITGLIRLLEQGTNGRKNLFLSILVFAIFTFSICWYTLLVAFKLERAIFLTTIAVSLLLLLCMLWYFGGNTQGVLKVVAEPAEQYCRDHSIG